MIFDRKTDAEGEARIRKAEKRVSSRTGVPVFAACLFIAVTVIYFGGYALTMKKTTDVPFDIVQYGTAGSAKKAEGIIIRSEKVFTSPTAGSLEYRVSEGEKIKSGTVVCAVSSGEDVSKAKADLEEVNAKILELQNTRLTETKHAEEIKKLNSQIQALSDEAASDFSSGNFGKVYSLKYSIEKKIDARNQLLLSDSNTDLELTGQRNAGLKALSEGTKAVTADAGGIISYSVDGMEAQLTPAAIEKLTKEQVSAKPERAASMKAVAAAGEAVFKVITSNIWHIAAYVPDSYTEGWQQGASMKLYINSGVDENEALDVTLQTLRHDEAAKEAFVVFKSTEFAENYMDLRNISFELEKPHTGIKIPTSSITQETLLVIPRYYILDGCVQKVLPNKTEESVFVEVAGNADTEGYVLVPMQLGRLNVNDTIRLHAGNATYTIKDVVTRNGVFLVNSGVTKFVSINLDNSVESEKNTILDPALNTQIKENDRIVHSIEDVRENQQIYE